MPPLVACGRHWEFGSDDLVFPGVASLITRTLWFVGVAVGVVYFRDALTCQPSHLLAGFAFAVLAVIMLTIVLEGGIVFFSARGTIVRTKPRKPVVHLLHFRVLVFAMEIVLLIIGTAFAFKTQSEADRLECSNLDEAVLITQIIAGVDWLVLIIIITVILIYLDPCHCYSAKVNHSIMAKHGRCGNVDRTVVEHHWRLTHSVWEKRFRVACCFAGSDDVHQVAYKEVAEIFAHLFCDTNVVLSDVAAGLVLLQREHFCKEERKRNSSPVESPDGCEALAVNFHDDEEKQTFKYALHFLKYALGTYSWPFYVYMNPACGCCNLCCRLHCNPCKRRTRPNVTDDNACYCYFAGLQRITDLDEMDIICVSCENSLYQVPFLVCFDHKYHCVVIAIRGTLSLHDFVTDLTASAKPIELPECPDFLVHKGMLKTATWILEKLEERDVLRTAFSKVPNYKLVVAGHSLGSGCACILSMLLRNRYPGLHCYCYSPPGSLLNEAAAEHTKDFVTSVTLGKDLVTRLSVRTGHILKDDIIRVLEKCAKPKFQILFEGALETVCKCCGRSVVFETETEEDDRGRSITPSAIRDIEAPPPNPEESLEVTPLVQRNLSSIRFHSRESDAEEEVDHPLITLYPPGRVIHIVDTGELQGCFCSQRQLEARWSSQCSFGRVVVSPDMIRDHFPDVLLNAMKYIWREKMTELEDSTIASSSE